MKNHLLPFLLVLSCFFLSFAPMNGQNEIKAEKGFSPQIGTTFSMMEDLKGRVLRSVYTISDAETDFLLDDQANRVGALILHLAATEKYYQVYTFENRGFNAEESKEWDMALSLGDNAREQLVGKPIKYYIEKWDAVRAETKRLLQMKDDKWFSKKVKGASMNNHWAWYHVMEHQANHMGQIRLILKRA